MDVTPGPRPRFARNSTLFLEFSVPKQNTIRETKPDFIRDNASEIVHSPAVID